MKKAFFTLLSSCLFILMISTASAQVVLPEVTITSARNIPDKVDKAFKSTFDNAQDPVWYQANKNYLVKFIDNDMKNNALFRKNGQMIYQISYAYEKDIPDEVGNMVKDRYKDYNIVVAFNVKQDQRDVWIVNLQNEKNMVTARVEDGVLNEATRTKRAQ
jgi:P pilus assembly chaperone PapD